MSNWLIFFSTSKLLFSFIYTRCAGKGISPIASAAIAGYTHKFWSPAKFCQAKVDATFCRQIAACAFSIVGAA